MSGAGCRRGAAWIALFAFACSGPPVRRPERGILVLAHGGPAEWNAAVARVVSGVPPATPVEIAFGMAREDTIAAALQRLSRRGAREIAVVRMFISGESFLDRTREILRRLATSDAERGVRFFLSHEGVGTSPLVDRILEDRVRALSRDPSRESVLLIGHGPGDDTENELWLEWMRRRARALERVGPFRVVSCQTLREDWPNARAAAERRIRAFVEENTARGYRVLVVPFRVAGFGSYREVLRGLRYAADGRGFCPHPLMTRWIVETARAAFVRGERIGGHALRTRTDQR